MEQESNKATQENQPQTAAQSPAVEMKNFDRLAGAVESLVKQERWSRRFANLLKLAIAAYVVFFIYVAIDNMGTAEQLKQADASQEHIAVIRLEGAIMPQSEVSAETMIPLLQQAFSNPASKAVVIKANSPGGSPVQSALINDEITRLKKQYQKPVIAVVEDMCASGCYYITVAADKIIANKGSLVGSIGVRMDSFGFTGLMDKLGIENRSMHAGEHKTFINPFAPKDEEGRKFFQSQVLEKTHQQFIQAVRDGRGDRIQENENTYTGLVWLGEDAVTNGMIDGIGDMGSVSREIMEEPNIRYYEVEKNFFEQLMGDISTQTASRLSLYFTGMR
ncbi:signal peptide peptidase SppA [Thiomicrorhabdus xiamenensis]|uniref:Signal peptide peptidase SppA n=1 Tax=Thiomicrorhabdus xiamenensis TaxID=2739063 RepID=A0A7D4NQW2_9GAMM|nr:signal peptide peptidase SppA [Thiomicrorhabdus xiamenensis]QKI89252.1 signal peptide peptidase SppA [Thiomicrorhabdus xiamenensis]